MLAPTRASEPLSADFKADIDRFLPAFEIAWQNASGYVLEPWQVDLLRRITELRPDGTLRYRQFFVSMPRQQGKSEIAAALGLWGMLRRRSALVIGIASSAEQANIIYRRAQGVILPNPSLKARFDNLTETRGIRGRSGSRWELKAAKSAALQGLPIDLGLVDEVHLVKRDLWFDLVNGTGGRANCMVVGITTAGDEDSELLKHLYKLSETGEAGDTFGFAVWEAPEARIPDDDDELAALLYECTPALESGRISLENLIADIRSMPEESAVQYRLNRFVDSSASFISPDVWRECLAEPFERPSEARPVFAFDRTPDWSWATVTAAYRASDGTLHTEVVASVRNPSIEDLTDLATRLLDFNPSAWAVDGYSLRPLAEELRKRGFRNVKVMSQSDIVSASSLVWGKIRHRRLRHAGDQLLTVQIPRTVRKNVGEAWRISRDASTAQIDAVMATVIAAYVADTTTEHVSQIF